MKHKINMRECIYCKQNSSNLTSEHIFPNFLLERVDRDNYLNANKHNKDFKNNRGQVLKQVCQICNSGPLSTLDNFAQNFIDNNDILIDLLPSNTKLSVDTNKLKKWISKIAIVAFPPQNEYNINNNMLKMTDFFNEEFKKSIIDPSITLNEDNIMLAFIDNVTYGIEENVITNIFSAKVSRNQYFPDINYISIAIGQLLFIIYRPTRNSQLDQFEQFHIDLGFQKLKDADSLIVSSKKMALIDYQLFYSNPELLVITKGYCLELLRLDLLMNILTAIQKKPESKTQLLSDIKNHLDFQKLDINESTDTMIRSYSQKYLNILNIINELPPNLVQKALEEHKKTYPCFKYYTYSRS